MAEQTASEHSSDLSTGLRKRVASFLRDHDPATTAAIRFLRARFDAGLAWLHFPEGFGELGLPRGFQSDVDRLFAEAGAPADIGRPVPGFLSQRRATIGADRCVHELSPPTSWSHS